MLGRPMRSPAMRMVLMTIQPTEPGLTLEGVREHYGLAPGEVDERFGVILIDPRRNLFTVRIAESALERVRGDDWRVEGPFADPEIGSVAVRG